jgi:DNA-directed RNA polymerase subunit M/transcription elongation factor TFIIS
METPTAIPPTALACRRCPKCGTRSMLVRIYPDRPGSEQRFHECAHCDYEFGEVVRLRKAG